jgi:hypothetical protein
MTFFPIAIPKNTVFSAEYHASRLVSSSIASLQPDGVSWLGRLHSISNRSRSVKFRLRSDGPGENRTTIISGRQSYGVPIPLYGWMAI